MTCGVLVNILLVVSSLRNYVEWGLVRKQRNAQKAEVDPTLLEGATFAIWLAVFNATW